MEKTVFNIGDVSGIVANHLTINNFGPSSDLLERNPQTLVMILHDTYQNHLKKQPLLHTALQCYVPQNAALEPYKNENDDNNESLNNAFVLPFLSDQGRYNRQPLLLLLGESGAGKSTYLHHLAQQCWKDHLSNSSKINRIPIIIECKSFKFDHPDLEKHFAETIKHYFNIDDKDIQTLKKLPILFIFDGYDNKLGPDINLYEKFGLMHWNAKTIITCRSLYLQEKRNYKFLFSVTDKFSCSEVYIYPFTRTQIDMYLSKWVKHQETSKDLTSNTGNDYAVEKPMLKEDYITIFLDNPELYDLIKNALLLKMVVEALPYILKGNNGTRWRSRKHDRIMHLPKFTSSDIYRSFIEAWFDRGASRLFSTTSKLQLKLWAHESMLTQEAFTVFCEDLSWAMFTGDKINNQTLTEVEYQTTSITTRRRTSPDSNPWMKFFTIDDESVVNVRHGCPLGYSENKYSYYHRSFLEYFIASYLYNTLLSDEFLDISDEELLKNLEHEAINQKLMTKDLPVIEFISQMIKGDRNRIERLLKIVRASRESEQGKNVSIAAANVMTILNKCHFNFSGLDINSVSVKHSDIRGAYFDRTNLDRADLTGSLVSNTWQRETRLNQATLHDIQIGQLCAFIHTDFVRALDYRPDINILISASETDIFLWDLRTGLILDTFKGHEGNVNCVKLNTDGSMFASGSDDNTIRLWQIHGGQVRILRGHTGTIFSISFNQDASLLASGSGDGTVRVWEINEPNVNIFSGHKAAVRAVSLSADGQWVASGCFDGTVHCKNILTGKLHAMKHDWPVYAVSISDDGQIVVSGGKEGFIAVWEVQKQKLKKIEAHQDCLNCLDLSGNGKTVASGSSDKTVRVMDVETGKTNAFFVHEAMVICVKLSRDMQTVCAGSGDFYGADNSIRIWDINNQNEQTQSQISGEITSLSYSEDGSKLAIGNKKNQAQVWEVGYGLMFSMQLKARAILGTTLDTSTNKLKYRVNERNYVSVSLSGDGNTFAFEGGGGFQGHICDLSDKNLPVLGNESTAINQPCLSRDGKILAYIHQDVILIKSLETGAIKTSKHRSKDLTYLTLSPDGTVIAFSGQNNTIRIWDTVTDSSNIYHVAKKNISSLSISEDKTLLAFSCYDNNLRIWNIARNTINVLEGHVGHIESVCLSNNGANVASGGYDKSLMIWNIATSEILSNIQLNDSITCVCATKNFIKIAVGMSNGHVLVFQSEGENLKTWTLFWSTSFSNPSLFISQCQIQDVKQLSTNNRRFFTDNTDAQRKSIPKGCMQLGFDYKSDSEIKKENEEKTMLLKTFKLQGQGQLIFEQCLRKAALNNKHKLIPTILKYVENIDAQDSKNTVLRTALHWAVFQGHKECVALLLKAGARSDIPDANGKTAYNLALDSSNHEIIELIDTLGWNLNKSYIT